MDYSPFQIVYFSSIIIFGIEMLRMNQLGIYEKVKQQSGSVAIFTMIFLVFCPMVNTIFATAFLIGYTIAFLRTIKKLIWK